MSEVIDIDLGWSEFFRRTAEIDNSRVDVGLLADTEKGGLHEVDPETGKAAALTVAEIGVVNEFGTEDGHVPARPFLGPTFDRERERLVLACQKLIWEVLRGNVTVKQALDMIGAKLAAETKATIVKGVPPPNAPSTAIAKAMKGRGAAAFKQKKQRHIGDAIADAAVTQYVEQLGGYGRGGRKAVGAARNLGQAFAQIGMIASVKTLIDTGRMLNAITWAVTISEGNSFTAKKYGGPKKPAKGTTRGAGKK